MNQSAQYPIREFARLTGVNPVTLRAWERRYGIIKPLRTEKGHRYYTDDHLERVNNILYWLDQGYPVRQVKLLLSDIQPVSAVADDDWQQQQRELLVEVAKLNSRGLDDLLNQGLANYPVSVYYDRCLVPVIEHLRADPHQHVLIDTFLFVLRRKLSSLIQQQHRHNDGPSLLMVPTHYDAELPLLVSSYALGAAGFRIEYFGTALTPKDIQIASEIIKSSWVWIHTHPANADQRQPWADYLAHIHLQHFISGAASSAFPEHDLLLRLPDSTAQQVQMFITKIGAEV